MSIDEMLGAARARLNRPGPALAAELVARGAVLVDCLGTWLSGAMERHGMWDRTPP